MAFKSLTLFICLLLAKANALDKSLSNTNQKKRCQITVDHLLKSGEKNSHTFWLQLKSKTDCQKASRLHRINFNPQIIKKVDVNDKWIEK